MARDLVFGRTNRDWSIRSKGSPLPGSANPNRNDIEHLVFNKWTAALLVGSIASSALLVTTLRKT